MTTIVRDPHVQYLGLGTGTGTGQTVFIFGDTLVAEVENLRLESSVEEVHELTSTIDECGKIVSVVEIEELTSAIEILEVVTTLENE